jgi:O-acetyl-ADP-ribose deacetylase (regulator of RNase III)
MIQYVKGDVTKIQPTEQVCLCHVINDTGKAIGAGVSGDLIARWPILKPSYFRWAKSSGFTLGNNLYLIVEPKVILVNMLAQRGLRSKSNPHPACLNSLRSCLTQLVEFCQGVGVKQVIMPKIASGLGGQSWEQVEELVSTALCPHLSVTVYEL